MPLCEGIPRANLVTRSRRSGRVREKLKAPEVALLETLDNWEDVVELEAEAAAERLAGLLGKAVRPEALAKAAATEPARVRERLRVLLRLAGYEGLAEAVEPAVHPETREAALQVMPAASSAA
ncbi:MAG: hypothetical protein ACRDZR_12800 [Acidimicrobiales bacterium]